MADLAGLANQRSPNRRSHTPDENAENANSFPTPAASSQESTGKPKQLPTITPRRFKRFFTPRSSLKRHVKIGSSRQVLRDITGGNSNRKSLSRRLSISDGAIQIFEDQDENSRNVTKKRKRTFPISPETTPNDSSPLKRVRGDGPQSQEILESAFDTDNDSESSESKAGGEDELEAVRPITRWKQNSLLGNRLRRECGVESWGTGRRAHTTTGPEWQHETANFFTRPEDSHACADIAQTDSNYAIPFCTASCNTNSLVAIGDEEGGIRLLDTDTTSKTPFSRPYLTFRPHGNAVLDLSFSHDDLLLATASGDQTSRVVDMPTQTAICGMAGHASSVKQVCFQQGSSSVIVTSSRDGSVLMWDLRCKRYDGPVRDLKVLLASHEDDHPNRPSQPSQPKLSFTRPVNAIFEAHAPTIRPALPTSVTLSTVIKTSQSKDARSGIEPHGRRGDVSITSLVFLPPGREHLLLTGSEANASVKLWDLRTTHSHRRGRPTPLSSTRQPDSHNSHRRFGLTSMALSGDGARLYTTCRDNTVYTYSTSHLILGHAPELSMASSRPRRAGGDEKEGLGPMYGFRHPQYHATTFYVKSALRPAAGSKSEVLAVGSSDGCAILFPTDEQYLGRGSSSKPSMPTPTYDSSRPPKFSRTQSGASLLTRLNDTIPIYEKGTALIRGHKREVTDMTWTPNGELVSVGDDLTARCWREGPDARDLRLGGEIEGRRWACGWAAVEDGWDDDE